MIIEAICLNEIVHKFINYVIVQSNPEIAGCSIMKESDNHRNLKELLVTFSSYELSK